MSVVEPEKAPGFPHPHPSTSFWLGQARSSPYIGYNSSEQIPGEAEVVIIGAGLSGVATAYFLLTGPSPPKSVVLLEAREISSGATGRNGGHCRPDTGRGFPLYERTFGTDQALKIIAGEIDTLRLTKEVVAKENIQCDFVSCPTVDVAMDDTWAATLKDSYNKFERAGGAVQGVTDIIEDPAEAQRITRVPAARAAGLFQAASMWPYKLVCGLLGVCIERGLKVFTQTPVTGMEVGADGTTLLKTSKGHIKASKVVHCQNAFVGTLLPEFIGKITPYRGQCSQITPTLPFSGPKMLKHTVSFRYAEKRDDFDYLIQRPADGSMILGGGRCLTSTDNCIDQTDDSVLVPELTQHLSAALPANFEGWGEEAIGEGLVRTWTGIMAMTHDLVPFVGPVDARANHFINAGHCGHGMARIMSTAKGTAALVFGRSFKETGLPECFIPSRERLNKHGDFTVKQRWMTGSSLLSPDVVPEAVKSAQ